MADDDNDDLDLGNDEPQRGAPVTVTAPIAPVGRATGIIDEDDRVIPARVDPALTELELAPWIFVRAHHNLPGWQNIDGGLLMAERRDRRGNVTNDRESMGFIPNNEEGVRAVELGFAELTAPPQGVEPPEEW